MKNFDISFYIKYFKKYLIAGSIISVAIILICKICKLSESVEYSNILSYVGVAFILLGITSVKGSHASVGDFNYQFIRTAGNDSIEGRNKQDFETINRGYLFFINMAIIAAVQFIFATIIWNFKIKF